MIRATVTIDDPSDLAGMVFMPAEALDQNVGGLPEIRIQGGCEHPAVECHGANEVKPPF